MDNRTAGERCEEWATGRDAANEALGWSGSSATDAVRRRVELGSPSTAPGALIGAEQGAERWSRVLEVERAVLALRPAYRLAIVARYLDGLTGDSAQRSRVCRALRAIGAELDRARPPKKTRMRPAIDVAAMFV